MASTIRDVGFQQVVDLGFHTPKVSASIGEN